MTQGLVSLCLSSKHYEPLSAVFAVCTVVHPLKKQAWIYLACGADASASGFLFAKN